MKVVCDNCGAVYKVPDEKLVKPVNKATCRQCGHRMLIPRPRADADPNERTLVTAVPPTPMGAPVRELGGERKTTPMEDEPEKTLPGRPAPAGFNRRSGARDEVPVFPGTPLPAGPRSSVPTADALRAAAGDTVKSPDHDDQADFVTAQPEPISMPNRAVQRPSIPPPSTGRRLPTSAPSHEPRRATPRPMVRSAPPPPSSPGYAPAASYAPQPVVVAGHDPSGDLAIAMAGVFGSLGGIFILAVLSVWPWRTILWLGLAVSIGGAITSLLILITGGRGTRPAWLGTSMGVGAILAVALATFLVSTHYVADRLKDMNLSQLSQIEWSNEPMAVEPSLPLGVQPTDPEPVEDPDPEDGVADVVDPVPEPEPVEEPDPAPRPDPVRPDPVRPDPVRPDPVRPDPVAPTPAAPVPAPPPAPAAPVPAANPSAVSYEVIDVMLRNNLDVKKCFFDVYQSTGALPPRVDVGFTLMPTGSVTGVGIRQAQYKGTPLEGCLGSAIRSVAFPPSSGEGQKIVYPFVLQ